MALTGARFRAADCLQGGIADVFVPSAGHDDLIAALRGGSDIDAVLNERVGDAGASKVAQDRGAIDRCFAGDTVEAIEDALAADGSDWARKTLETMAGRSPTSQKIVLRQIALGAGLDFDDCMRLEYRLSQHCMAGHDFFEGVRAVVIDKDQKPQWRPARLSDVTEEMVAEYFAPLGPAEITFD
jgi:enoyl-CoA hydratase